MKIEKLPSGSYRVRKMYKGIQYSVTFEQKPTQKEALQALSAEMDKAPLDKKHMTFRTASDEYIDSKSNVLSPSTITGYKSIQRSISKKFNGMIITDITSVDVQTEINAYSKGRSAKTVRNLHAFITSVMGMYAPNTVINTTLPLYIKKEPYIPTDADVKAVVDMARGTKYEIALILAVFGLRRSEICALTIDDIEDGQINIDKAKVQTYDKQWVTNKTKTDTSTRVIEVPIEVTDKIKAQGYIYKGSPNNISKFLTRTQDKIGLPHFTIHKLRHYYASVSHSLGIPDAYIMKSGGWKTDNVMKTVYRHALADKEKEMEKKAGNYLKNVII